MNGKKVLITGGLGNLGSWISLYLAKHGYEIFILTRKERCKLKNIQYRIIECDITNLKNLDKQLNFDIDYCIHTASYNEYFHPDYAKKALKINVLGTRNLLEVLSKKNLKNFVYFSTFHVYGVNNGVITENTLLTPKNDYASTHLFAEYYIKQFYFTNNLNFTILRLTNSYGMPTFKDSNKWYLVLNDFIKSAYDNGRIIIKSNGEVTRDFIYMGDVASIVDKLLIKVPTNDIYNLSSGHSYKVKTIANIIKKSFEQKYNETIEIEINNNDKNIYGSLVVSNDKLKSAINFKVRDMMNKEINNIFELLEMK